MGTMTKLLNKPLRTFIVFTCVVLACSIPAYFYLIESIWLDELDDHNLHLKEQIQTRFNEPNTAELNKKIELWNQIQVSSQITPASDFHKDSVYISEREMDDNGVMELERFRGLFSTVSLNGKPYNVAIETNVEEVHETVFAISMITCLFILLLILGFILLNRRLSKRIWMPFTDTLEKLKQFDLNSASVINFVNTDIQEFAELNETLVKLIDNNVRVYTQQKEFTQNASHELQTPLALLKTKIDLLIQDASLTTQQRKVIESLDNSISRVTRINKNLLLLVGIENKRYESESVDLSELVKSLVTNFTDFAEDKGSGISMNVKDGINIQANESLVEILISNLLSNTVRHGVPNSGIAVTLNEQVLIVSNEGKGSLNENNLFKRFISATAHNPGTGLGLAIVKEISEKYGWRVTYTFTGNQHVFSVFF
jgi:signal transduction histidine kinase